MKHIQLEKIIQKQEGLSAQAQIANKLCMKQTDKKILTIDNKE